METADVKEKVFVGLSGGVDSSVAAARLIDAGYDVVGVFIKVWHPDWMVCNWEQERLDAMRVAAHLGIPFLTCDAEKAYRDDVAQYFIEAYKAGRTPNPDIMCNQYVKFGRFLDWAKEQGADYIATGHYAQKLQRDSDAGAELHRGVDQNKDQTYFLARLSKKQLEHSLFPVGDTPKDQIRAEAETRGIPVAAKKDSQGICFLGHVDIAEFLSHYIELEPGAVLNTASETIGRHHGALTYTLGQRHGFTIETTDSARAAYFVIDKDIHKNTLTVATEAPQLPHTDSLTLHDVVLRQDISNNTEYEAQIRYRQTPFLVTVTAVGNSNIELHPTEQIERPASGQTCVLYRGTHCLGGGTIG